ncbi:sulfotransferase-like domain-containing protein [Amycolatopsis sp. NPDC005003]
MTALAPRAGWLSGRLAVRGREPVLVILSPPRCGSTATARAFWRHPVFGWYVHEPYDRIYHGGGDRESVGRAVDGATGLGNAGSGVVVKEMTFQAGSLAAELLTAATLPVVVTVRDPRLAIRSRMRQRARSGEPAEFPAAESGWADLTSQLALADRVGVSCVIVEFTRLRARPAELLPALCARLGLEFTPAMLGWPSATGLPLGQLGDRQRSWYRRVLASTGFEPPDEETPAVADFPPSMRPHVGDCVERYRQVLADSRVLTAGRAQEPS